MKRRISALFCFMLFSILHGQESPIIRAEVILPATRFPTDLKHEGFFNFKGIQISNYYEMEAAKSLNINNDGKEDFLVLLVPKSIIPPLDDEFDFDCNKYYKRVLVEVVSCGENYKIGSRYNSLVSNRAGLGSGFDGIDVVGDDIIICHSKPNGNIYWELKMWYHYVKGRLFFYRVDFVNNDNKTVTTVFEDVVAENISISDFLP